MKGFISLTIDKAILDEIERRRGLVKLSTYVNDLLKGAVSIDLGKKELGPTEDDHNG